MVGADGMPALPWLGPLLRRMLSATRQAHALLLRGPRGVGQFELAVSLAQGWLCEAVPEASGPCGRCASCRLVQVHSHPDLLVLVPEALQPDLRWGAVADADDAAGAERSGKAKSKPSSEIKVEAVRSAVGFAQTTAARGRGKVVVLHPAERMNPIAATALLKTLEEPAGDARFVLSCAAPEALLPTIRSRCQDLPLALPAQSVAVEWLAGQGVVEPAVMLAATGGQPQEALAWAEQGVDAALWTRLPERIAQGDAQILAGWPLPRVVDVLQKICHDAACAAAGAAPRYFAPNRVRDDADPAALAAWMHELNRVARHADHPWSVALVTESLVQQGRRALASASRYSGSGHSGSPGPVSLHSRR